MAPLIFALLALLVACAGAVPANISDEKSNCTLKIAAYTVICKKELNLTEEDIEGMVKEEKDFSQNTRCYIECLARNFDVFVDGRLVEAKVLSILEDITKDKTVLRKSQELQIFNQCKAIMGKNNCDTAAKIFACTREAAKKMGLSKE